MESKSAVAALSALAQENRLEVFRLLVQAGAQGLPAGQIAEKLGISVRGVWAMQQHHGLTKGNEAGQKAAATMYERAGRK